MAEKESMASSNVDHKVGELKKDIRRLAMQITGDKQVANDDNESDHEDIVINNAIQALSTLKELNPKSKKRPLSSLGDHFDVPVEFCCPISKEIMKDPVILSSGQTFDRPFIHKWLKDVLNSCPETRQVLSKAVLTPNQLVLELIEQWCKDLPAKDLDNEVIADSDRDHLTGLLHKLSSSTLSDQKQAAKEIRLITKTRPSIPPFFVDVIQQLLNPLSQSENLNEHSDLREDLVSIILNLSIPNDSKKTVGEHPLVIPLLVESLTCLALDTRSNAAAALFSLSWLDSNKVLIGEAYALKPLVDLLAEDQMSAMKDASQAIYKLCELEENRRRAVGSGAVRIILRKINDGILVDVLLATLARLATDEAAIKELVELGAVKYLFGILTKSTSEQTTVNVTVILYSICWNNSAAIKEIVELGAVKCFIGILRESTSENNKEHAMAILYFICRNNRVLLKEVRDEEKAHRTFTMLADQGSERARKKAKSLLEKLDKGSDLTTIQEDM